MATEAQSAAESRSTGTGASRYRVLAKVGAACAPPAVYFVYVWHYSLNLPFADDWSRVLLIVASIHGHTEFSALWQQYAEGRLLIPNLVLVWLGSPVHFNLKVMIGLGAATFIASYVLLLTLFRSYLGRPLPVLAILSVGVTWFSLADTGNSLWAFQFAWYLVIFFCILMLVFLLSWPKNGTARLVLAIAAAVAASLSMLQGFLLWPLGLICLLWTWERTRAHVVALVSWAAAACLTLIVYTRRYKQSFGCGPGQDCSLTNVTRRPVHYARFFSSLPGYVVPKFGPFGREYFGFHQALGIVLLAAAGFVIFRSLRERKAAPRSPLPLVLITFALLFDALVTVGRGSGRVAAASQSRFTMPNILLIVGLVLYAWAHVPAAGFLHRPVGSSERFRVVALGAFALFVCAQAAFSTRTGLDEGRAWHRIQVTEARVLVNQQRIPSAQRLCYLSVFVTNGASRTTALLNAYWLPPVRAAQREHLYVFEPSTRRKYRALGPPHVPGVCALPSATNLTPQHGGN